MHVWMGVNPVKPQAAQSGLFVLAAPEPVKLEITLARIRSIVGEGAVGSPELLDTHRPRVFEFCGAGPLACGRPPGRPAGALTNWRGGLAWGPAAGQGACPTSTLALRIFRPVRTARVALASGQPSFVAADGIRGKVLEFAGPWRTSGDWWTVDPWSRDEWDIALSDGALYRLYCNPRGWFVEGSYD
jgi:protein ImuB